MAEGGHPAPACLSSWSSASAAIPGRNGRRAGRRPGLQPGTAGAGGERRVSPVALGAGASTPAPTHRLADSQGPQTYHLPLHLGNPPPPGEGGGGGDYSKCISFFPTSRGSVGRGEEDTEEAWASGVSFRQLQASHQRGQAAWQT